MNTKYAIEGRNITKKYKGFELDVDSIRIPAGFATALIGENGAGKTTLLNILAGIRLDNGGEITYFGENTVTSGHREPDAAVKERIGYTGTDNYYLPTWTIDQIEELEGLLFDNFDRNKFEEWVSKLAIAGDKATHSKKVSSLSDGTKTKLMLAGVLARDTDLLLLDEPASPLDPLMRDKLCEIILDYIAEKEGRTVFFSTHNISDMEGITDYAIIMAAGRIVEQGFVDDLKEKYVLVKGEAEDAAAAEKILFSMTRNKYGFEGICLSEDLDKLAGMDIVTETTGLFDISVAIMKKYSKVR